MSILARLKLKGVGVGEKAGFGSTNPAEYILPNDAHFAALEDTLIEALRSLRGAQVGKEGKFGVLTTWEIEGEGTDEKAGWYTKSTGFLVLPSKESFHHLEVTLGEALSALGDKTGTTPVTTDSTSGKRGR